MRITFQHTNMSGRSGTTVICAGGLESHSGMQIEGEGLLQVLQYPRSEEVDVIGRGNKSTTITFSVIRTFITLVSAESYMCDVHAIGGLSGLLTLELASQFGGLSGMRKSNCGCQRVRTHHEGVTVFAAFAFLGAPLKP